MSDYKRKKCPEDHEQRWTVYTQREVGEALGVDQSTVGQWVRAGAPRTKAGGNRYAYCLPCLSQWIRARTEARQELASTSPDDLLGNAVESEWGEEFRKWKARSAQAEYYRDLDLLIPVDLWVELDDARYRPFIEWANDQIVKHGNGSEASYMEALEESRRRTEAVLRKLNEPGEEAIRDGLTDAFQSAATDADR